MLPWPQGRTQLTSTNTPPRPPQRFVAYDGAVNESWAAPVGVQSAAAVVGRIARNKAVAYNRIAVRPAADSASMPSMTYSRVVRDDAARNCRAAFGTVD